MGRKENHQIRDTFEHLGEAIVRYRSGLLMVIFAVTLAMAFGLPRLTFQTSIESYFPKNSKIFADKATFEKHFGNSDYVACLIRAGDVFAPDVLEMIRDLGAELEKRVPFADRVISLTTVEYGYVEDGGISVAPLVPAPVPENPNKIQEIREQALSRPYLAGRLVSADATETWLMLELNAYPDNWKIKHAMSPVNAVGKAALEVLHQEKYSKYDIQATGWPIMVYEELVFTEAESTWLMAVALMIAVVVLGVSLRSVRGVMGPFLITAVALINVFGVMGYLDIHINAFLFSVPVVLILAIAIGYSIHLFNYFHRQFTLTGNRRTAAVQSVRRAGWPICFSALTTIGALLSFLAIELNPIQWLGATSAVLILVGYLLVMTLMPILLSLGGDIAPGDAGSGNGQLWSDRWFEGFGAWIFNHPVLIMVVFAAVMAVSVYGITKTEINIDTQNTYGPDVPYINRMQEIAGSDLGVFNSYNIILDFKTEDAVKNPKVLSAFQEFITRVQQLPLTKTTFSMLEILKEINRLSHDGDQPYYRIPDSFIDLGELFMTYEMSPGGPDLSRWVGDNYDVLRLQVGTRDLDSRETLREINYLHDTAKALFPDADIIITGGMPEYAALNEYVARGQVRSLAIALGVITLLMMMVFKSVKLGLIGLVPNITPLLIIGGVMGLSGTPLDFLTITIAPMILGLSVDDTIHFFDYIGSEYRIRQDYREATQNALKVVGRALLMTTLIIVAAFVAYCFSNLNIMVNLGVFIILGIISALLADYLVAPILIRLSRPFTSQ